MIRRGSIAAAEVSGQAQVPAEPKGRRRIPSTGIHGIAESVDIAVVQELIPAKDHKFGFSWLDNGKAQRLVKVSKTRNLSMRGPWKATLCESAVEIDATIPVL